MLKDRKILVTRATGQIPGPISFESFRADNTFDRLGII
jgi:hypothetical protein